MLLQCQVMLCCLQARAQLHEALHVWMQLLLWVVGAQQRLSSVKPVLLADGV